MCQVRCQLVLSSKISIDKNIKNIYPLMFCFYPLMFFSTVQFKKKLSCQSDHSQRATFALRMC